MVPRSRHPKLTLAVLAVAILGLVLAVDPPEADAALPSWVQSDTIVNACNAAKNFPLALLGVSNANGALALPSAGSSAVPKPGADIGGRAGYYFRPVTANEGQWMAYNPANSPAAASTALRQQLWGSANTAAASSAVPLRVVGAAAATPVATPGAVVAASGTATATTSTALVTTSTASTGATVTAAGGTITGGSVAAALVTGAGAFCGTTILLDYFFGEDPALTPASTWDVEAQDVCNPLLDEYEGARSGDRCWLIDWPGTIDEAVRETYGGVPRQVPYATNTSQGPVYLQDPFSNATGSNTPIFPEVLEDGSVRTGFYDDHRDIPNDQFREPLPGRYGLVLPCAEPTYACGMFDQGENDTASVATLRIRKKDFLNCPVNCFLTTPIDWNFSNLGKLRRLSGITVCQTPGGGSETFHSYSDPFWDQMEGVQYEAPVCPIGTAPVEGRVVRQKAGGGMTGPITWPGLVTSGDEVTKFDVPDDVRNNPTTLACLVVGATDCQLYDPDPNDPDNPIEVGGPGGEPSIPGAPDVGDIYYDIVITFPELPGDPDLLPEPTTPTVPAPGTPGNPPTPPSDPPTDTTVPPSDPPPPPSPPDGGDNQWSTCMEDQVDSDWAEVTFNPVTWVRAIIFYVTAPIICALWWLVVPPGGFDALLDVFRAYFEDSETVGALMELREDLSWNSGCAPVDFGDPMAGWGPELGSIDVGMCGNLVVAAVWTVLLGLAVISMAGSLVRTLWTFGQYEKAGYI